MNEKGSVAMETEPKGLEASLEHLIDLHHHKSLVLAHHTGLFSPFSNFFFFLSMLIVSLLVFVSRSKLQPFLSSLLHLPSKSNFVLLTPTFFIWVLCRQSQEGRNKESRARFWFVGWSGEWWGPRFLHQPEANWARNSNSGYHHHEVHEANWSMARCHSCPQHCSQGVLLFTFIIHRFFISINMLHLQYSEMHTL